MKRIPKVTLKEIGDEIGRTRERVRQLISDSHKDNDPHAYYIELKDEGEPILDKVDYCIDGDCGKWVYKVFTKKSYFNKIYLS